VALVIPTVASVGGAERMVLELASGLAERDWRVTVVALSGDAPPERRAWMTERGVSFLSLGMRKAWIDPRGWRAFYAWQRSERPDVLHGHLAHGAWFVRAARRLGVGRVAVVDTLHSTRVGGRWTVWLYRATSGLTDRVTAVSEAARRAAMEAGMAREIIVVANGIDGSRLVKGIAIGRERVDFVWLAVGRLAAVKDYPRLLRAFADVSASAAGGVRLEIAGEGEDKEQLQAMARELGIAERVRWHGFCEDVGGLYRGADGVVLASRWEGLPVCLMEAGAAGLPVVTTATAGAMEVVSDGTGVLVDGDADDALAKAMLRVMAMPEEDRRRMGDAARAHVLVRFSKERMVAGYESVYRDVLRLARSATSGERLCG
jgi:glycosyltransferase involved in cell wall biosynthesis